MGDVVVSKTVNILNREPAPTKEEVGGVVFSNIERDVHPSDTNPSSWKTVVLHQDLWSDLGEPEQITVTVEPGDHLNV